jgi:hypothetical protein
LPVVVVEMDGVCVVLGPGGSADSRIVDDTCDSGGYATVLCRRSAAMLLLRRMLRRMLVLVLVLAPPRTTAVVRRRHFRTATTAPRSRTAVAVAVTVTVFVTVAVAAREPAFNSRVRRRCGGPGGRMIWIVGLKVWSTPEH